MAEIRIKVEKSSLTGLFYVYEWIGYRYEKQENCFGRSPEAAIEIFKRLNKVITV